MTTSPKPTKDEALRALDDAISMIDSLNSAYGSDEVDAVARAGREALAVIRETLAHPDTDDKAVDSGERYDKDEIQVLTAERDFWKQSCAILRAPYITKDKNVWAIDRSAGRPILVLNGCSVIEAEDAEYVLSLIRKAADDKAGGEVWKPVVGYEGLYEVSNQGQLKNVITGSMRSTKSLAGAGYVKADLWKDGIRKQTTMHRLVAEAFIGPLNDMEVNHKNGIKTDNRAENLEIVTKSQNEQHSRYALGNLCKPVVGISDSGRQFYPSIEEAARKTSASAAGIYRCLNGQATESGSMKWEYATESDTRPQPQAAQPAERVALTDERIGRLFRKYSGEHDNMRSASDYARGIKDAEAAHVITAKDQS